MFKRQLLPLMLAAAVIGSMFTGSTAANAAEGASDFGYTSVSSEVVTVAAETPAQKAARLAKKCLKKGVSRSEIVCIAKSQVGMREWRNNCNPYTSRCEPWCGDFAAWVMKKAGGKVPSGYPAAKAWRKWTKVKTPKPGDAAVKSDGQHVEIVVAVYKRNGKTIIASIGGNSGDKVTYHSNNSYYRWTYHRNPSV